MYSSQGKYDEALQYYQQALTMSKAIYGDQHPDVVGSLHLLAITQIELNLRNEAIESINKALEMLNTVYAPYSMNKDTLRMQLESLLLSIDDEVNQGQK